MLLLEGSAGPLWNVLFFRHKMETIFLFTIKLLYIYFQLKTLNQIPIAWPHFVDLRRECSIIMFWMYLKNIDKFVQQQSLMRTKFRPFQSSNCFTRIHQHLMTSTDNVKLDFCSIREYQCFHLCYLSVLGQKLLNHDVFSTTFPVHWPILASINYRNSKAYL